MKITYTFFNWKYKYIQYVRWLVNIPYNIMVMKITPGIKSGLRSWLLAPSLSNALILGKLLLSFDPWFPQQLNGDNNNGYLIMLVGMI